MIRRHLHRALTRCQRMQGHFHDIVIPDRVAPNGMLLQEADLRWAAPSRRRNIALKGDACPAQRWVDKKPCGETHFLVHKGGEDMNNRRWFIAMIAGMAALIAAN